MSRGEMELPIEIWYNILSYENYPYRRRVSRYTEEVETSNSLTRERSRRIKQQYPDLITAPTVNDKTATSFVLHHPDLFNISDKFLNLAASKALEWDRLDIAIMALNLGSTNYTPIATIAYRHNDLILLSQILSKMSATQYVNTFYDQKNTRRYATEEERQVILDLFLNGDKHTLRRLYEIYPNVIPGVISQNMKLLRRKYDGKIDKLLSNLDPQLRREIQ